MQANGRPGSAKKGIAELHSPLRTSEGPLTERPRIAAEDLVPTPPERRVEKRLLRPPLSLPAAIQLTSTLVPSDP